MTAAVAVIMRMGVCRFVHVAVAVRHLMRVAVIMLVTVISAAAPLTMMMMRMCLHHPAGLDSLTSAHDNLLDLAVEQQPPLRHVLISQMLWKIEFDLNQILRFEPRLDSK
jgi:hypothetical protein